MKPSFAPVLPFSRRAAAVFLTLWLGAAAAFAVEPLHKCIPTPPADAAEAIAVWDARPELRDGLPRNFRTTDKEIVAKDGAAMPSLVGLKALRASGGSQFTERNLKHMLGHMRGSVVIYDLRQETHVLANDIPVSWFATNNWANVGRSDAEIEALEAARVGSLTPGTTLALADSHAKEEGKETPVETIVVTQAATERQIVERAGARYVRIAISDHTRPLDAAVDRFVESVRELPADAWPHFHCRAGMGRTTTFFALYDMLRNAGQVSLEDIVLRQQLLIGDYDILRPAKAGSWNVPYVEDRIAFVRAFYDYARANPGGRPQLWSEWLAARGHHAAL